MVILYLLLGFILGTIFGYMIAALCAISSECSRNEEKYGVKK